MRKDMNWSTEDINIIHLPDTLVLAKAANFWIGLIPKLFKNSVTADFRQPSLP